MRTNDLLGRVTQLIQQARAAARGEGLSLKAYRAFEERLGDIQEAKDQEFAHACFPDALLRGFLAGCWHYRSLSQRGSIWAIHPHGEWESFEQSQDVFDRAYRFTQVMTEFFRQTWLTSPTATHAAQATVTLQQAVSPDTACVHKDEDSLHIEYPDSLATLLLPPAVRPVPAGGWSVDAKQAIRMALRTARLDTYLHFCQSQEKGSPVVSFLDDFSRLQLFKVSQKTTFPPRDPMKDGVFTQIVDPLLQLIQSGIFWLDHLTAETHKALTAYLLLYPPGSTRNGVLRCAWPWCSVNLAVERSTPLEQRFLDLHREAFNVVFSYVYGDNDKPILGEFAPGAELAVLRLAERLARQTHEGHSLSFQVVVGLKSVVNNGLRCSLAADNRDRDEAQCAVGRHGQDPDDRLAYYAGKDEPRKPEVLQVCPVLASRQDCAPPEDVSSGCTPNVSSTCREHDATCLQIANAVLGNYSFFQQRDAVLWAQAENSALTLHRAFTDRGFLFPAQPRTRHEIVRELCLRNPAVVVYECSCEGVHRVQCTYRGGGIDVMREKWTGDRFTADREWLPWEAVNRAYECYCTSRNKPLADIPDWCEVLYRVVERLVDGRKGGTFVLAGTPDEADQLTYPMTRVYFIERHCVSAIGEDVRAECDLYHLAMEDGAVVLCLDADTLILGRRYLTPKVAPDDSEWYGSGRDPRSLKDGARHTSARLLSKSNVVVLCVSADGPISLYSNGIREMPTQDHGV